MERTPHDSDFDGPGSRGTTLPSGTVTFLFTDIERSTRLWQEFPGTMPEALARHHALLQHAIESHGGYVFQIVGDGFCAAFRTADDGLTAALAGQRALHRERWGETGPLRVRMALHTGSAEVHAGRYTSGEYVSGLTLSRAARLLSVGHGGQILMSRATQELLGDRLLARVELRDLGERRLRDLVRPEHVFQVVAPDLPSAFPPLRAPDVLPNNLPVQLTTFVGRDREISELKRLLAERRLLTLVGPGGTGKTRLSLQAAAELLEHFPDGAWLVELASLRDAALVPHAAASALEVREEPGRPPLATLIDHLRPKTLLLVLDNCEHLVDACAQLADRLLRACPQLKIVATSREALGVAGEVTLMVPSLSFPDAARSPHERFAEYEAVRLFVARAGAVLPDFAVTSANAGAVAEICQRLDGIPLAIELAAARLRALTVQQIAAHLNERFRLLAGGSRTALPRHRTLRGLIDWSYDLLAEPERVLLRRLSVFAGGWTLEAAGAVCAGEGLDEKAVLDLLGRLIDKSLAMMDDEGGDVRYRLLETIRQYGGEKLDESADDRVTRDRHRDYYLRIAEEAEPRLQGTEQSEWLARLEADHDNLRAALRWSLDRGDVERSLRFGSALWLFWDTRAHVSEGRGWLDTVLARADESPGVGSTEPGKRARAKVLDGLARMSVRQSELARARAFYGESLRIWRELNDKGGAAEALNNLGDVVRLGDHPRAKSLVQESLALFRELSDKRGIAHALNNLADLVIGDDQTRAKQLFEESVLLFREIGDRRGLAHGLNNLGGILALQGEYPRAEALYRESLGLAQALGDKHAVAVALRGLGGVALHRVQSAEARAFYEESAATFLQMGDQHCAATSLLGLGRTAHESHDQERARALGEQCLALFRELGVRSADVARTLNLLGRVALAEAQVDRALELLREGLVLQRDLHDMGGLSASLEDLAGVAAARRQYERMVRLLGAAHALRAPTGIRLSAVDRNAHERAVSTGRAQLSDATFATAWAEGAAMTLEQAIALAAEREADPEQGS